MIQTTLRGNKAKLVRDLRLSKVLQISTKKPFLLASGIESGIFFDTRKLALYPSLYNTVLEEMDKIIGTEFNNKERYNPEILDIVVNVPHAADYCAGRIARELKLAFLQLEKKGKRPNCFTIPSDCLEELKKHKFAIVADDVLTTGGSAKRVVSFLQNDLGIKTKAVSAILDRQLGAGDLLLENKVKVCSLLEMGSMLQHLLEISSSRSNQKHFPDTVLNKEEKDVVKKELRKIRSKNPLTVSA